jgi:two-component system cell cycle response regulator
MCYIYYLKKVNNNFGHDAGDYFLQALCTLKKGNIRAVDIVVRWGGQ